MSNQLDFSQGLVLRDGAGDTVGIVLAPKAVQDLTVERDRLREEVDRLRGEVAELRRTLDEARQEVCDRDVIAAERDLYLQHLEMFWAEKIADMDENGIDFEEVIVELERDRNRNLLSNSSPENSCIEPDIVLDPERKTMDLDEEPREH